jgi:hypothetical protein
MFLISQILLQFTKYLHWKDYSINPVSLNSSNVCYPKRQNKKTCWFCEVLIVRAGRRLKENFRCQCTDNHFATNNTVFNPCNSTATSKRLGTHWRQCLLYIKKITSKCLIIGNCEIWDSHGSVVENSFLLLLDTVSFCACVRASVSHSFKERKCLLRQSWNIYSPGVRVPWKRRHCVSQKCVWKHTALRPRWMKSSILNCEGTEVVLKLISPR